MDRLNGITEAVARAMSNDERLRHAHHVEIPFSEVCVHMCIAGQTRPVLPITNGMAWILDADGTTFSSPVTRGEAGIYDA